MKRIGTFILRRKLAILIALGYVGLGTLSVCSVYPADLFYDEWVWFGLLVSFPVSIISFGYRYADPQLLYLVFIIQVVMFFLTFLILGTFMKKQSARED